MLKRSEEFKQEVRSRVRGGTGEAVFSHIWAKDSELNANMRLFSVIRLAEGDSIGYHVHEKEDEIYYILSGKAEVNDNGDAVIVSAGDSTLTRDGEGHSIKALDGALEILAVIVKY